MQVQNYDSVWSGLWFYFEVEGQQLAVYMSYWSGRTVIWLDDEPILDNRSLRLSKSYPINIQDQDYVVKLGYENWKSAWWGYTHCDLLCANQVVDSQQLDLADVFEDKLTQDSTKQTLLTFGSVVLGATIGGMIGAAMMALVLG